jgi:hypothetical protein
VRGSGVVVGGQRDRNGSIPLVECGDVVGEPGVSDRFRGRRGRVWALWTGQTVQKAGDGGERVGIDGERRSLIWQVDALGGVGHRSVLVECHD